MRRDLTLGLKLSPLLLLFISQLVLAKPVYTKPNWPLATENLSEKELSESIVGHAETRWLLVVNKQGKRGWILHKDVINPLFFSKLVNIKANEGLYAAPNFRSKANYWTKENIQAKILKQEGAWAQVQLSNKKNYWVKDRKLEPVAKDPGVFITNTRSPLKKKPLTKTKIITHIPAGAVVEVKSMIKHHWAQVKYNRSIGYIPLSHLKSRLDIAYKVRTQNGVAKPSRKLFSERIYEIFVDPMWVGTGNFSVHLRSAPSNTAQKIAIIKPWEDLTVKGRRQVKWTQSWIPKLGYIWWEAGDKKSKIKKVVSKLKNIKQIVRNPKFRLFFASAGGLYRSLDGMQWEPLDNIEKKNHAMAMAKDGTLFVGEKVSVDHGKSFQPYIRWDRLIERLQAKTKSQSKHLGIIKISPIRGSSKELILKLDVGKKYSVRAYTKDQGRNWNILR